MAVVRVQEITLVPFPVREQRRTLEPDGLAIAEAVQASDGSGGNNQITFRGPTSHLYLLRQISVQATGISTSPANGEYTGRAFWIEDATPGDGLFVVLEGLAASSVFANKFVLTAIASRNLVDAFSRIPLGAVITRPSSANGFFITDLDNLTGQTITVRVVFTAYRREALTVPGFLDTLQAGTVR